MDIQPKVLKKIQDAQRKKLHEKMHDMLRQLCQKDTQSTEYAKAMQVTDVNKMDEDLQGMGGSSIAGDSYQDILSTHDNIGSNYGDLA